MLVAISYRGIRIAEGNLEGDGDPGFLPFDAPLPVGTRVMVFTPEAPPREAIVAQVVEQDAGGQSVVGMKLRWAPAAAVPEVVEMEAAAPGELSGPAVDEERIEPAHSTSRTQSMPAIRMADEDEPDEPADSPKQTMLGMPAISEEMVAELAAQGPEGGDGDGGEAEPAQDGPQGKRKRRRRR